MSKPSTIRRGVLAAVAAAGQIADLKGLSVLACGIGSLRQALKGDAAAAEAGTQTVLVETKRTKLPNMLTASPQDVQQRVFRALGLTDDEAREKFGFLLDALQMRAPPHGGVVDRDACGDHGERTNPAPGAALRRERQPGNGKNRPCHQRQHQ